MAQERIPIIMYHSINDASDGHPLGHLSLPVIEFEQHLRAMKDAGFAFLTMRDLWEGVKSGRRYPGKPVVLTFDDGFLDNLLNANPILEKYGAKATIFVCPEFIADGAIRTRHDVPDARGYLNWQELEIMEASGRFDVQSHTMSHNFAFISDRLVDVYTSQKFPKYYWLTYLLAPETKLTWSGGLDTPASSIPDGFPIFEYGRALSGPQFIPGSAFIDLCIAAFRDAGEPGVHRVWSARVEKGRMEATSEFRKRIQYELCESKKILEMRLRKEVNVVCFPGGRYTDDALRCARKCGYDAYVFSSREPGHGNSGALSRLSVKEREREGKPVGLTRISFSQDYPGFLPRRLAAYGTAALKIQAFRRPWLGGWILRVARAVRNGLRRATWGVGASTEP